MTSPHKLVRGARTLPSRWAQSSSTEDLVWDEEESAALRQTRKDATLSASADSVREYLKQIGKVALLSAEQEVALAQRIVPGSMPPNGCAEPRTRPRNCPRSCAGIWAGSSVTASAPKTTYWKPTCGWWCRWSNAIPAAACHSWT